MELHDIERRKLTLDDLARIDAESGVEFWYARDIMGFLGYRRWENFAVAVERAKVSGNAPRTAGQDHFREATKMIEAGKGAQRKVKDYKLTRYACYLIAQNVTDVRDAYELRPLRREGMRPCIMLPGAYSDQPPDLAFDPYCNYNIVAIGMRI